MIPGRGFFSTLSSVVLHALAVRLVCLHAIVSEFDSVRKVRLKLEGRVCYACLVLATSTAFISIYAGLFEYQGYPLLIATGALIALGLIGQRTSLIPEVRRSKGWQWARLLFMLDE